ncbi:acyl-CoA dehydrogenase [Mycobacterium sp. JS623]|uniref:acyl-CoA dehydrogenase family protein n=1 Tax=Mycobacterium sp. JS623 TaxID=212767 RepID=UPI0002A56C53|nr:acyl-CoA dehydrogenase family protein [Mycobacterium sp. JS623]AGB20627.1 acyl-CoA dehydrogenase [Mycobacterium sp. JS623]
MNELAQLVEDLCSRSTGDELWRNLDETGLARLTSSGDGGPAEAAIVLSGLARHAAAVPVAETDLLAAWLANKAGLPLPSTGPLTVAIADATSVDGRLTGTAREVPWPASTVVLAARTAEALHVGLVGDAAAVHGHNIAGEPRGSLTFDVALSETRTVDMGIADELTRRGAWARCSQIMGALDAACEMSVAHTGQREQFGRQLNKFQAVQHSLAAMAGEIERARAATALAVAAAADYGFDYPATDYAVTVAKVAVGRAVEPVTTIAHQLHGAIGVTSEHRLWLATMRARSWVDEFGSTGHYARRLGRLALAAHDPWDVVVSYPAPR